MTEVAFWQDENPLKSPERDDFLFTHGMAHETIYTAILSTGVNIDHSPLIDFSNEEDWMLAHAMEHAYIEGVVNTGITLDLVNVDWHDESDANRWLQGHASLHQMIDQTLGL